MPHNARCGRYKPASTNTHVGSNQRHTRHRQQCARNTRAYIHTHTHTQAATPHSPTTATTPRPRCRTTRNAFHTSPRRPIQMSAAINDTHETVSNALATHAHTHTHTHTHTSRHATLTNYRQDAPTTMPHNARCGRYKPASTNTHVGSNQRHTQHRQQCDYYTSAYTQATCDLPLGSC